MSVSNLSYHAACKVGFQPPIGRTQSWRISFFNSNTYWYEGAGHPQSFGHILVHIWELTDTIYSRVYGSTSIALLLVTIQVWPLHKVLLRHFSGKFYGQYTFRLGEYYVKVWQLISYLVQLMVEEQCSQLEVEHYWASNANEIWGASCTQQVVLIYRGVPWKDYNYRTTGIIVNSGQKRNVPYIPFSLISWSLKWGYHHPGTTGQDAASERLQVVRSYTST